MALRESRFVCLFFRWKLRRKQMRFGKIQGDGRKFLDRFKSYFRSQISSQSSNEIHICRLQLKSATKGEFFRIIFVFDCQFQSAHVALCGDLVSQQQRERFLSADFGKTIALTTQRS